MKNSRFKFWTTQNKTMKLLIRAVKNHHNMFICNTMHLIIKRTNPCLLHRWFNCIRHNRQINTSSSTFSGYLGKNFFKSLSVMLIQIEMIHLKSILWYMKIMFVTIQGKNFRLTRLIPKNFQNSQLCWKNYLFPRLLRQSPDESCNSIAFAKCCGRGLGCR